MDTSSLPQRLGAVRLSERRTRLATAAIGALLACAAGWLAGLRFGGGIVSSSYDLPFLVHRAGNAEDLRIVYLDAVDGPLLDRSIQPLLLDKLSAAGARAVVYDVIFDTPSKDPAVDTAFAAAIRRFRGIDPAGQTPADGNERFVFLACGRELILQTGAVGEQLILPVEPLLEAANDIGLAIFLHDPSYTVRELATGSRDEASLAWKTALALGTKLEESRRSDPRWLNYAGPPLDPDDPSATPAIVSCSARNVLDETVPGLFRDKIVVIGGKPGIIGSALGQDLFATPFHRFHQRGKLPHVSGVELQATAIANLMRENWLRRTTPPVELLFILATGLLAGAGLSFLRPLRGIAVALGAITALAIVALLAMHFGRLWFPWTVPAFVQIPVALVWGAASHFYVERFFRLKLTEEQRKLRDAFAKYLSPQMLQRLTEADFRVETGGEKAIATIMFTDIEGFTDMCQRVHDPARIVETLNDYFDRTTGHVFDHDGIIIKFIGDAIFAVWGVPFPDPDAPRKAARAAWKLFESDKLVVDGVEMRTRIGLHHGEVLAGNLGSKRHVDYSLIGDAVNLASRLEGLNKLFGTCILITDALRDQLDSSFRTRQVGRFKVKGRSEVTVVHELLGPARQEEAPEWINEYHAALAALDSGDVDQARRRFTAADQSRGPRGDGPSRFFLERLDRGEAPRGGVIELKEK